MALTRKFLTALGIEADKIDEIITAHSETVDGLKEQINATKANADALDSVQKDLEDTKKELASANDELEKLKSEDWAKKYEELKSEYDSYKADVENKASHTAKADAYRKLLKDAGVSENRIDTILKVSASKIDSIEFEEDGNVKDSEKLTEDAKTEWADFIPTTHEKGADVANPPANNGGDITRPSRAAELVAQYRNEHYGNPMKED